MTGSLRSASAPHARRFGRASNARIAVDTVASPGSSAAAAAALRDLRTRVGDMELRVALDNLSATLASAFGHAPAGQIVVNLNVPPDPDRSRRFGLQIEVAHAGLAECVTAIARLNALDILHGT